MAERPILFSTPLVQAILAGRKTQTRRPARDVIPWATRWYESGGLWMPDGPAPCGKGSAAGHWRKCPFGRPGDLLYVLETFIVTNAGDAVYRADYPDNAVARGLESIPAESEVHWRPSIHMPKWASRLWLRVTDVRVERVQDITEEDARAEGVEELDGIGADQMLAGGIERGHPMRRGDSPWRFDFAVAWCCIYGDEAWDRNEWVWAISFERVEAPAREGGR